MDNLIPHHIAIIMDGNGRWAKARGLPRTQGHRQGAKILENVLRHAQKKGVKVLTLFAFSSENWARPKEEVDALMDLFRNYLKNDVEKLKEERVRVSFIGNRQKFPADLTQRMNEVEAQTKDFDRFHVVLALGYGARDDLAAAARKIAQEVADGQLTPAQVDAGCVAAHLSTAGVPEPDLLIRTSGEQRVSNFLLWELAYSEFYWADVMWPDFNEAELDKAIEAYSHRQRRFGKV